MCWRGLHGDWSLSGDDQSRGVLLGLFAGWLLKADEAYSSQIPPGHATYVSPVDMQDKCYQHKYDDSVVTDPDEIARLNRGELLVGESMLRQAKIEPDSFEEGAEDE